MIGHQDKIEIFKKLADNDKLFHAYFFFGEPQIGKFLFTASLANYLEYDIFEEPKKILEETLVISPAEKNKSPHHNSVWCGGKIGIESVRKLQNFLFQSPILSKKRIVIIRDAENLTTEAQNALLKIVEDNPPFSLIIFVSADENSLLPSLFSRLQKIYFSRVRESDIEKYLKSVFAGKEGEKRIKEAVKASFGRPGRAIASLKIKNQSASWRTKIKNTKFNLDDIINNGNIDEFFENKLIELRGRGYQDINFTRETLKRLSLIKMFNVNKKLQLKALLNKSLWKEEES